MQNVDNFSSALYCKVNMTYKLILATIVELYNQKK